jgi:hypothetical protein
MRPLTVSLTVPSPACTTTNPKQSPAALAASSAACPRPVVCAMRSFIWLASACASRSRRRAVVAVACGLTINRARM